MGLATDGNDNFINNVEEALDYVIMMRKLYDASNGKYGAFIVAVNISIGLARVPLNQDQVDSMCDKIEELGQIGILTIVAAGNSSLIDYLDEYANFYPPMCPSEYTIVVASSIKFYEIPYESATGPNIIDIAAVGEDVYTTMPGDEYGSNQGSSFAAPQVTAAVSLIYSLACDTKIQQYKEDPASFALEVKEKIIENARQIETLEFHPNGQPVINGGKMLDVYESLKSIFFEQYPENLNITGIETHHEKIASNNLTLVNYTIGVDNVNLIAGNAITFFPDSYCPSDYKLWAVIAENDCFITPPPGPPMEISIYNDVSESKEIFETKKGQTTEFGVERFNSNNEILVYPNPFEKYFEVVISLHQKSLIKMDFFDANNVLIKEFNSKKALDYLIQRVEIPNLPSGTYFLKISGENFYNVIKLVKL